MNQEQYGKLKEALESGDITIWNTFYLPLVEEGECADLEGANLTKAKMKRQPG